MNNSIPPYMLSDDIKEKYTNGNIFSPYKLELSDKLNILGKPLITPDNIDIPIRKIVFFFKVYANIKIKSTNLHKDITYIRNINMVSVIVPIIFDEDWIIDETYFYKTLPLYSVIDKNIFQKLPCKIRTTIIKQLKSYFTTMENKKNVYPSSTDAGIPRYKNKVLYVHIYNKTGGVNFNISYKDGGSIKKISSLGELALFCNTFKDYRTKLFNYSSVHYIEINPDSRPKEICVYSKTLIRKNPETDELLLIYFKTDSDFFKNEWNNLYEWVHMNVRQYKGKGIKALTYIENEIKVKNDEHVNTIRINHDVPAYYYFTHSGAAATFNWRIG